MECDHCIIRLRPSGDQAVALIALEREVPSSAVPLDQALREGRVRSFATSKRTTLGELAYRKFQDSGKVPPLPSV